MDQAAPAGKRKGGPAADALKKARPAYEALVKHASASGRDRHYNKAIAAALADILPKRRFKVIAEKPHQWIPSITPDVNVEAPRDRIVCLEFHYTNQKTPNVVAGYVLKKLDRYMRQLEYYLKPT